MKPVLFTICFMVVGVFCWYCLLSIVGVRLPWLYVIPVWLRCPIGVGFGLFMIYGLIHTAVIECQRKAGKLAKRGGQP